MNKLIIKTCQISILAFLFFAFQNCSNSSKENKVQVKTVLELVDAVNGGKPGDLIFISSGVYELDSTQQLTPKSGMTIQGAGIGKTILTAVDIWTPGLKGLPANEQDVNKVNQQPYLFKLESIKDFTISDMTFTATKLHGAIFANKCSNLNIFNIKFVDFRWSSIYTFDIRKFLVHDCIFEDAGGKVEFLGAGIFNNRTVHGDFFNCKMYSTLERKNAFVGFKGMGNDSSRIHHNTVETGDYGWAFVLEYMHSDNSFIEIDHNRFNERISIPRGGGGGTYPKNGYSFWIHHNYLTGYSEVIEGPRGGLIVDHNLVELTVEKDGGNFYTDHDNNEVLGSLDFHNNLIKNPGRGIFWSIGKYNDLHFSNNHVIANTTITPREDGLFDINGNSDFENIEIKDNIIEINGLSRPLMRNDKSRKLAKIENNHFVNVADTMQYENKRSTAKAGLIEPLNFECGYKNEYRVNGWSAVQTPEQTK